GLLEALELVAAPELLVVDSVTPFDLAVLLRPARPDVAMADPRRFHRERELEGELPAAVALQPADGGGQRREHPPQEGQARGVVQRPIEPQDTEARAVVEGGVLERPATPNPDELHIHLDGIARLGLLEEFELARGPLAGAPQVRQAEIDEDPLQGP